MEQLHYIVNPKAGTGRKEALIHVLTEATAGIGKEAIIHSTQAPNHAGEIAKDLMEQGVRTIVAVGGDGTVNEVACALMESNVNLGIIPVGSGNGLARTLGIPLNVWNAVEVLNSNAVKIDAIQINNNFFFNVAGVGFDGLIATRFAGLKRRGIVRYIQVILNSIIKYRRKKYSLELDGKKQELDRSFLVAFSNSKQYGNNFIIAPDAVIDDGLLDVCIVHQLSRMLSIRSMLKYITGGYYINRNILTYKASHVKLSSDDELQMHIDGEPYSPGKFVEMNVRPAVLSVLIP